MSGAGPVVEGDIGIEDMGAAAAIFAFLDLITAPRIRTTIPTISRTVPTVDSAVVTLKVTGAGADPGLLELSTAMPTSPPFGWFRVNEPEVPDWIVALAKAERPLPLQLAEQAMATISTDADVLHDTETGMLPVMEKPDTENSATGAELVVLSDA